MTDGELLAWFFVAVSAMAGITIGYILGYLRGIRTGRLQR